eukprot:2877115-Amphidinium_carterae.2
MGERQKWLQLVAEDGFALRRVPDEMKSDRELVLTAVARDGFALECAAEELRNDRQVVLMAVAENVWALQYAADALLEDESFAVEAREQCFFFKITTLAGRSCMIACTPEQLGMGQLGQDDLLVESCYKLSLQRTGKEVLLFENTPVPDGPIGEDFPGRPSLGKVVEYQLVILS